MCILGLNSPGFKFHLATLLPLYRVKLLCLGRVYFVKSGLFLLMALVWWYFPKILSVSHCSQKGHCFVICHLSFAKRPFKENFKNSQNLLYFLKNPLSLSPHSKHTPPPPHFCSCKLLAIICCKTRMDELSMNNTLVYLECIWCYFHQINQHFNLPVYLVF